MNIMEQRIAYYKTDSGAIDLYPAEFRNLIVRELEYLLQSFQATYDAEQAGLIPKRYPSPANGGITKGVKEYGRELSDAESKLLLNAMPYVYIKTPESGDQNE